MTLIYEAADPACRKKEFLDWVRAQGITPEDTYRIDVDFPNATVYQYKKNAQGKWYAENGQVARHEPFHLQLTAAPPLEPVLVNGRLQNR